METIGVTVSPKWIQIIRVTGWKKATRSARNISLLLPLACVLITLCPGHLLTPSPQISEPFSHSLASDAHLWLTLLS